MNGHTPNSEVYDYVVDDYILYWTGLLPTGLDYWTGLLPTGLDYWTGLLPTGLDYCLLDWITGLDYCLLDWINELDYWTEMFSFWMSFCVACLTSSYYG